MKEQVAGLRRGKQVREGKVFGEHAGAKDGCKWRSTSPIMDSRVDDAGNAMSPQDYRNFSGTGSRAR